MEIRDQRKNIKTKFKDLNPGDVFTIELTKGEVLLIKTDPIMKPNSYCMDSWGCCAPGEEMYNALNLKSYTICGIVGNADVMLVKNAVLTLS